MNYHKLTSAALWSRALTGSNTDRELYFMLSELVIKRSKHQASNFFPPQSGPFLLELLEQRHDPQLIIIVCKLVGYLCNVTSTAKEDLAKRGVTDLLLHLIELVLREEKGESAEVCLNKLLLEHVMSAVQYFSLGPKLCHKKLSTTYAVRTFSRLVDKDNPSMFCYDSSETLRGLVLDRVLVGEQFEMTSSAASTVFYQQLGHDFKSYFNVCQSYVLDLYDTNTDEDIHIVEELSRRSNVVLYGSRNEEHEVEDISKSCLVDVSIKYCLNCAHFWAVLGRDNIDRFSDFETSLSVNDAFPSLETTPVVGQMVGAPKDDGGLFRAQVLTVKKNLVTVFAVDYGFMRSLPTTDLRAVGHEVKFRVPGLACLCKLMGVRRKPVCQKVTISFLQTLCNLTADLSPGMTERILETNLLNSLNHLSTYSDTSISTVVIQILSNMSRNERLKTQLVNFGILESVIGILKSNMVLLSSPSDPNPGCVQLIECCVVLFWNLIYNCERNKDELLRRDGLHLIVELCGVKIPEPVRRTALKTLKAFTGKVVKVSSYADRWRPRKNFPIDAGNRNKSSSDSEDGSDFGVGPNLMSFSFASSSGSDDEPKMRLLPHTVVDEVDEFLQGHSTYLQSSIDCELMLQDFNRVSRERIAQLICGFLNRSSEGGSIYFGLKKDGMVEGQTVSHSDRDRLRLCVDGLTVKHLSPSTIPGIISTLFHPVLDASSGEHATDHFVIEIRVKPTFMSTLYGVKNSGKTKHFVRVGKKTVEMSAKDIYVWTVETTEALKLKEIQQLEQEIEKLKKMQAKIKSVHSVI